MNVTHPNYGQNYRLTRAALRLGTFTISELMDLTGALKNTVYSFISKLRNIDKGFVEFEELQTLRGRPQKRYSLTKTGTKYLGDLNFEMASRFGEDSEQPGWRWKQSRSEAKAPEGIALLSDIYEQERDLVVHVEVPGLSVEDLDVRLERNDLIVSGDRPAMFARGRATAHMIERRRGHFVRAYTLPDRVEAEITNVEVRNGVLEVILRKAAAPHVVVTTASGQSGPTARSERVASAAFPQLKESAE
jgi:HSP20 family protein